MSKPPAKAPVKAAAPARKPAAKAAAKPAARVGAKTAAKPPAKPAHKPAAKAAPKPTSSAKAPATAKAAPKAAGASKPKAEPAAKTAPSAPVKPAAPAAHGPAKSEPSSKPAAPKTAAKSTAAAAPPAKAAPQPTPAPAASKVSAVPALQVSPVKPAAFPQPVAPAPAPISNRFTDRFAPARTTTPEVIEPSPAKPVRKIDPKLANAWKSKAGRELTDDELLAMPDSEYMNDKQIEFFRVRLQQQKDDLLSNAGETTEHLREDTSIVPDPVDRATIEEEHALELRTRDRERKLLKKIAQSLSRLESGEYGFCAETGEPIGLARLLARPTATLSLEAQQRRELKQKMFGD